jgi:outer membrane protein assembly factor BamA
MFNQELRFPLLNHLTIGFPFGDLDLPEIQGALFTDLGKATFETSPNRATLGSYGISFRLAVAPLAVLRLDVGRRFSNDRFRGYGLDRDQRDGGFVSFFFGTNY